MTNAYYNKTGVPATNAPGSSQDIRAEFSAIQAGFDKLPSLAGNAGKSVIVNPGGNALIPDPVLHLSQSDVARGTDIAVVASGSVTIPAIGSYFVVTGTGFNVTGFANSYNGRVVTLLLPTGLTLVNSASFILKGFNRVTFGGDIITIVNDSSGVWRELNYNRVNGDLVSISHRNNVDTAAVTAGSSTKIAMTTSLYDPYGMYSLGAARLNCLTPGIYQITCQARITTLGTIPRIALGLHRNGSGTPEKQSTQSLPSAATPNVLVTAKLSLAVGDYIEPFITLAGTGSSPVDGAISQTFFEAWLLN